MKHLRLFLLVSLGLLTIPRLANAGCPAAGNGGCDMAMGATATFSPPVACLSFYFDENDCVCRNDMVITNNCTEVISAIGYEFCEFGVCGGSIEPGATGTLGLPIAGSDFLGPHSVDLTLNRGTEEIHLALTYEMANVDMGGCSAGGGEGTLPGVGVLVTLLVLFGLRRRSRSAPTTP